MMREITKIKLITCFLTLLCFQGVSLLGQDKTSLPKFDSMQPATTQDGWQTDSVENVGLSVPRLRMMEQSIQKGDFKNVTSVLIARNGALSYEGIFRQRGRGCISEYEIRD